MSPDGPDNLIKHRWFGFLVVAALIFRLAVILVPGNSLDTPWSAGNDTQGYVLLAQNLVAGSGYTYAGEPTAFRAPGYPFLLAGLLKLFGPHFVMVARWVQLLAGIAVSYFCSRIARILFDDTTAKLAFLVSLVFPTLVFFTSEILTETVTALFVTIFCWLLAREVARPALTNLLGMGLAVGCGSLFRPNVLSLTVAGLFGAVAARQTTRDRTPVALLPMVALLVLSPWIRRNQTTFGSSVLLSTQGGLNALVGAIDPEGRTQPGETELIRATLGFVPPQELETNSVSRRALGSEAEMNRRAWRLARRSWGQMHWHVIPWAARKWKCFWLSTEQVFTTSALPVWKRAIRLSGVMFYWTLLVLAGSGLWRLRRADKKQGHIFLLYAMLLTIFHTPFVMNTRIRAPLLDPLLAVLAAGGCVAAWKAHSASPKLSRLPWEASSGC